MSDRHMHITGFLHPHADGVDRFIETASRMDFFAEVYPVRRADGTVIAVAFLSKDLDGISDELGMPEVCEKLSGILDEDIVIASAWQHPQREASSFARKYDERESVWLVRGRDRAVPGEVVSGNRELEVADGG
jgi:hypothetical protein